MTVATPAFATVQTETPSANAVLAQMEEAQATLQHRLAGRPDQARQLHAALAHLARLHDTAMSARHIQGGVLSTGQRERLSHRIAVVAVTH